MVDETTTDEELRDDCRQEDLLAQGEQRTVARFALYPFSQMVLSLTCFSAYYHATFKPLPTRPGTFARPVKPDRGESRHFVIRLVSHHNIFVPLLMSSRRGFKALTMLFWTSQDGVRLKGLTLNFGRRSRDLSNRP